MGFFKVTIDYGERTSPDGGHFKALDMIFNAYENTAKDLRTLWPRYVPHLQGILRENFRSKRNFPVGGAWKPLSRSYAAWKAKHFPGKPLLVRTGRLLRSLANKTSDTIDIQEKTAFTYGFDADRIPYGVYHQDGLGRNPQRKFMYLDKSAVKTLAKETFMWIKSQCFKLNNKYRANMRTT